MLEEAFQTADTRPRPAPWSAIALVTMLAFATGAAMALWWADGDRMPRLGVLAVALAVAFGGATWNLRAQLRRWQRDFGAAVEYVARRKREHEAGIRFEAP